MPTMIATPLKPAENGRNYGGDKRLLTALSAVALYVDNEAGLPTMKEVVTARIYGAKSGNGSRNYASLWIRPVHYGSGLHSSGHGWAGGGGYHRPSAALSEAISSAGWSLSEDIDGRGDRAMEDAVRAIAAVAAPDASEILIISHGG